MLFMNYALVIIDDFKKYSMDRLFFQHHSKLFLQTLVQAEDFYIVKAQLGPMRQRILCYSVAPFVPGW